MIVWMDEQPLVPGKQYLFKHTTKNPAQCPGTISQLRYRVDVNTLHSSQAPALELNEIGRIQVELNQPVHFDSYRKNRVTGAMIVIDKMTNSTVGAAMIVDRSSGDDDDHWDDTPRGSVHSAATEVSIDEWSARFGQQPTTILLTGLTGAGKTTIANALQRRLFDQGRVATVIDGQSLRAGLSRDLDFSAKDRSENLRRCVEVAQLINQTGTICICAFVSPSNDVRQKFRNGISGERFLMAHLSAPLEVCRKRDTDGIYEAADRGEVSTLPGLSAPYEVPEDADIVLPTHEWSVEKCVDALVDLLQSTNRIG
jgi:bifunctional enzyme CysN/CysC